ncbi:MAG TPA: DinB family protein [Candidatus Acidoferrales bacterium]|nr:DinB family protein [Candidatus Acidoferrales bacterium]
MMTSSERETLLKNLADSRERLLGTVKGLSREQLHFKPAPDRWSVAENVEHLTFVEGRVLGFIQKTLSEGPAPEKRSVFEGKDKQMVEDIAGRITRFQAPEPIRPCGRWADDQLLKEFETARQSTRAFASSTEADLRAHFFRHPVFGEIDCYQWLLLIAAHCDRHRAQSEEVMASAGFPRSSAAAS